MVLSLLSSFWINHNIFLPERVKALGNLCPNIEALYFQHHEHEMMFPHDYDDIEFMQISKIVSGLNFKNLTSLSLLRKFDMEDGSFLISVLFFIFYYSNCIT